MLERCVFNNIKGHIYSQINPCQHGFVPGKNCASQLIEVFDKIGSKLDRGKQIDVFYLDMSKAFDKVSHKRLLLCLREYAFRVNILNWFQSYLQDRRQQTTILGASSSGKMLGFIKRSTRTITNCKARRTLYFTLVRSQMGYATQLWSPQTIHLISRLERAQRRASKYILDLPFICETSYKQRLIDLNFLPLSYWHEYLDMLFFYKTNCSI